jgi:glycosyltransferase involved in cell wall biosynthesis
MHIAILDEELPYPLTSGKRIRTYNLVSRLADRHRLTYICHRNADPAEAKAAESHFRDLGIQTVIIERTIPPKKGLRFYARLAANLGSPLPYSVAVHAGEVFRAAVEAFGHTNAVDLWHCEWTPYAQVMRSLPYRWIVMAHNVESLIWQRLTETESNPVKRWYIRQQWKKYERFERWVYTSAYRSIAVSPDDACLMRDRFGATRVDVVDNGVDTRYFEPGGTARDAKRILFLGSLDWRPNLDAVRLLLDSIFPAVQAKEPAAKLNLVGRNPPTWLREAVSRHRGVELHGSVPDVRPFIAQAGVMAVPLRIGGGSRLKILEALASALPVVSTRIGAEGLDLDPVRHATIVADESKMAEALIHAIRQPAASQAQAIAGRVQVLHRYDWDTLADRLDAVWLRCSESADVDGLVEA